MLLIPFITEMAGLIISAKAPGNQARAGADFGFSVNRVLHTILQCFTEAGQQAMDYLLRYTYAIVVIFLIGILLFHVSSLYKHINFGYRALQHIRAVSVVYCAWGRG